MGSICVECHIEKPILAKGLCKRCYNRLSYRKITGSSGRIPKDPLAKRRWSLRNKYGISLEQYARLYALQYGKCKICGAQHDILDIDHNHSTNEIRGLLCRACNTLVGHLEERKEIINLAYNYIKEYNGIK